RRAGVNPPGSEGSVPRVPAFSFHNGSTGHRPKPPHRTFIFVATRRVLPFAAKLVDFPIRYLPARSLSGRGGSLFLSWPPVRVNSFGKSVDILSAPRKKSVSREALRQRIAENGLCRAGREAEEVFLLRDRDSQASCGESPS